MASGFHAGEAPGAILYRPAEERGNANFRNTCTMEQPSETKWAALAATARAAAANAYCPYSGFRVGAAVLSNVGAIASGCNVENASYGLTICAERNAVFRAIADGAKAIVAVTLYTPTAEPSTLCGACRQVIAEFGADAEIRCYCDGSTVATFAMKDRLPAAFTLPGRVQR